MKRCAAQLISPFALTFGERVSSRMLVWGLDLETLHCVCEVLRASTNWWLQLVSPNTSGARWGTPNSVSQCPRFFRAARTMPLPVRG
jgi:hypothetical protein